MAKLEYRSERLEHLESCEAAVAQLNRWGRQGWEAFQIERLDGAFQIWLRRELPVVIAGLQGAGP